MRKASCGAGAVVQAIRHPRGTLSAGSGLFLLREAGAAMMKFARYVLPAALVARGLRFTSNSAGQCRQARADGAPRALSIRKIAALAE